MTPAEPADAPARPRPPVVLDLRWTVGDYAARPAYEQAHIAGARFVGTDAGDIPGAVDAPTVPVTGRSGIFGRCRPAAPAAPAAAAPTTEDI